MQNFTTAKQPKQTKLSGKDGKAAVSGHLKCRRFLFRKITFVDKIIPLSVVVDKILVLAATKRIWELKNYHGSPHSVKYTGGQKEDKSSPSL